MKVTCEHCKQRNATVTVTQVQNGQKVEHHYCDICASQFHPFQADFKQEPVSIQQLLSNWFGTSTWQKNVGETKQQTVQQQKTCPQCGFTYKHFLKEGKFGCPSCYDTFEEYLPKLFNRIQAGPQHIGNMPGSRSNTYVLKKKIEDIRKRMKDAVESERFEEAAKLRDAAREIEQQLSVGGGDAT
ncbi:MAG: UvrB/UvrC motif-containing protein [Lysinibacillus sp.]